MSPARPTTTTREVEAGCYQCSGAEACWVGPHAQGVAARHHDAKGHTTWVKVSMSVQYGTGSAADLSQPSLPFGEVPAA